VEPPFSFSLAQHDLPGIDGPMRKDERHVGEAYQPGQSLNESYAQAKQSWKTNGQATDASGLVVEVGHHFYGGHGIAKGEIWLGKAAINSVNTARVFWMGQNAARVSAKFAEKKYAASTGGTTLEMTLKEGIMDLLHNTKIIGDRLLWKFSDAAWDAASARFADGARSATVIVGSTVREVLTWTKFETLTLARNGVEWVEKLGQ
jgi:hypothetical protein